jgi:hypothetical protein
LIISPSRLFWSIWLLRNKIFNSVTFSRRVAIWLLILDSNFTYTRNDILRSSDDIKLWYNKKILDNFFVFIETDQFFFYFFYVPVFYFDYWFCSLFNILSIIIIYIYKRLGHGQNQINCAIDKLAWVKCIPA